MTRAELDALTRRYLARRLIEAKLEAIKAELMALAGEPLRMPHVALSAPAAAAEQSASAPKSSARLSEVVSRLSEERQARKSWTVRTAAQYREIYGVLVDLLGDPEIGTVTKESMRQLGLSLTPFPSLTSRRSSRE